MKLLQKYNGFPISTKQMLNARMFYPSVSLGIHFIDRSRISIPKKLTASILATSSEGIGVDVNCDKISPLTCPGCFIVGLEARLAFFDRETGFLGGPWCFFKETFLYLAFWGDMSLDFFQCYDLLMVFKTFDSAILL